MKLIGQGLFSKCYLLDCGSKVLIKSSDKVKECSSLYGLADSALFPEIIRIDFEMYEMKYFPKVKSLKNSLDLDQWRLYKELRSVNSLFLGRDYDKPRYLYKQFNALNVAEDVKQALYDAVDSLQNYGYDINFEISPRNVAVENGKIILLDCFFFSSQAQEIRTLKSKNRKY
jgi:hypothetical protein